MRTPVVHPKLHGTVSNAYPSKCTIQLVVYTANLSNQQIPTGATDIAGMIDIPCETVPIVQSSVSDNQTRNRNISSGLERRECMLNGYFPQIINDGTMQAQVDSRIYTIEGVEHDSQRFATRIRLSIMRP